VIAALTLSPPTYRPITVLPHDLEHLSIFVAAGLAYGLGYVGGVTAHLPVLIVFSATIELAQIWDPGRHARLSDFVVNVVGVMIGLMLASMLRRYRWPRLIIAAD
jgi:VanZ family protein